MNKEELRKELLEDAATNYAENTIAVGDKDFLLECGFIAGAEWESEREKLTHEEMRQPIEDALYSTKHFLTTHASEFAEGILLYLKEAGYRIVKYTNPTKNK